MKKHFVTFFSPGTFVHESTTEPIESWDIDEAVKMSKHIVERHGARPFAFQFSTKERGDKDLDSKVTKQSGTYFIGGRIMTLDQVKIEMPNESILISNMENNGINRIVVNNNSYRSINPLRNGDVVLPI